MMDSSVRITLMNVRSIRAEMVVLAWMVSMHTPADACQAGLERTVNRTLDTASPTPVRMMPNVSISSKISSVFAHQARTESNVRLHQTVALEILVCMVVLARTTAQD